jgi:hypothetical protein
MNIDVIDSLEAALAAAEMVGRGAGGSIMEPEHDTDIPTYSRTWNLDIPGLDAETMTCTASYPGRTWEETEHWPDDMHLSCVTKWEVA